MRVKFKKFFCVMGRVEGIEQSLLFFVKSFAGYLTLQSPLHSCIVVGGVVDQLSLE